MAAGITMGLEIEEYSPKKIKQSITGNGNASKEQVSAMLNSLLKVELKDQYLDATDALAAAVCHYHQIFGKRINAKNIGWRSFINDNPSRIKK